MYKEEIYCIRKSAVVMLEIDPRKFTRSVHAEFCAVYFRIFLSEAVISYFKARRRLLFHVVSGRLK